MRSLRSRLRVTNRTLDATPFFPYTECEDSQTWRRSWVLSTSTSRLRSFRKLRPLSGRYCGWRGSASTVRVGIIRRGVTVDAPTFYRSGRIVYSVTCCSCPTVIHYDVDGYGDEERGGAISTHLVLPDGVGECEVRGCTAPTHLSWGTVALQCADCLIERDLLWTSGGLA